MPAIRELLRASWLPPNVFRSRDVVYGQYEQIGAMEALKQFLGEIEIEDPSAVIVRHSSKIFPRDIFAVHWQFWPKNGFEGTYQLSPSQRGNVPSWFTSKGVGIEVDRDGTTYVRFTKSPIGWDYLRDNTGDLGHPFEVNYETFLSSLRLVRPKAEPADDYRFGRGDRGSKLRLDKDKDWRIIDPEKLRF